jgi:hypothetical protein
MSNLYDTGAPRKVVVVNEQPVTTVERVTEREVIIVANTCRECGKPTRTTPCEWCHPAAEPMREAQRAGPPELPAARAGAMRRIARRAALLPPKGDS